MSDTYTSRRRIITTLGLATTGILAGCNETNETTATPDSTAPDTETTTTETDTESSASDADYYVSPDGNNENDGSQTDPLSTISAALNQAQPGDTIYVFPGEYVEAIFTVRDGEPDNPITITGPEDAVITPPPETYSAVTIRHHHTHLRGMTINGLINADQKYEDWRAWAGNCVQISPLSRADEGVEYVRGAVVEPTKVGNTRRALIQTARIRDAVIGGFEVIGPAGMKYNPRVANYEIGHVGEIVYVGLPADAHKMSWNPYDTPERTRNVRVHHINNSAGYSHNDFVDIKPGCTNVTVEYCTDRNAGHNTEGLVGPAIPISGDDCTIRWNDIGDCPSPIGFLSWKTDGKEWGKNNEVYGNRLHDFAAGAFNFRSRKGVELSPDDQRILCGNDIDRGNPDIEPWVPNSNGFNGDIADHRGENNVTIQVGAGPDGHAFDPAVVMVDPGTTITWEWVEGSGAHYVVSRVQVNNDPDTIPDLIDDGTYSTSETLNIPEMKRYACYNHHDDGMLSTIVVAADADRYAYATGECKPGLPETDGIGHTAGNQ